MVCRIIAIVKLIHISSPHSYILLLLLRRAPNIYSLSKPPEFKMMTLTMVFTLNIGSLDWFHPCNFNFVLWPTCISPTSHLPALVTSALPVFCFFFKEKPFSLTVVILRQLSIDMSVLETEKYKLLYKAFFFFHIKKTVLINHIESRPWKKQKSLYRSQIHPWKIYYLAAAS